MHVRSFACLVAVLSTLATFHGSLAQPWPSPPAGSLQVFVCDPIAGSQGQFAGHATCDLGHHCKDPMALAINGNAQLGRYMAGLRGTFAVNGPTAPTGAAAAAVQCVQCVVGTEANPDTVFLAFYGNKPPPG